jgi:hypothetical protein
MISVVEQYAASLGWHIGRTNVLVEGTSDVTLLGHASSLHAQAHGTVIIDGDFSIFAAGRGDDGGVDGVKRGLITFRQVADVDRDASGAQRYRFVGLFDNDFAGRNAFNVMPLVDPRIERYKDIFLLQPIMPPIGDGIADRLIETTIANLSYSGLDWEIEDLCAENWLVQFETANPRAVLSRSNVGGRTHREIDRAAKADLVRLFIQTATLADARELVMLLKLMRGYLGVSYNFVQAA